MDEDTKTQEILKYLQDIDNNGEALLLSDVVRGLVQASIALVENVIKLEAKIATIENKQPHPKPFPDDLFLSTGFIRYSLSAASEYRTRLPTLTNAGPLPEHLQFARV